MKEIDAIQNRLPSYHSMDLVFQQPFKLLLSLYSKILYIVTSTKKLKPINMNILTTTVARLLYAIPMAFFGILHLMNGADMSGMVPSFIPGGVFWVYLTGLALISAAVSIIIQKKARLACLLLAAMLIVFVLTMHLPGLGTDMQASMPNLLKDTALAGAALSFAGLAKD
jgi:uncharacterized membrane protein YphA (DoxX/SURF4 family)